MRLLPSEAQKELLTSWFGSFRWYYNYTLDVLQQMQETDEYKNMFFHGKLSNQSLRDFLMVTKPSEEKWFNYPSFQEVNRYEYDPDQNKFPIPNWMEGEIPSRIPRGAVKNLTGNINSCLSNLRNGNITHFQMRRKTKRDSSQVLIFEDSTSHNLLPKQTFGETIAYYKEKHRKISLKDLSLGKSSFTIYYDKLTEKYFLCVPRDLVISSENQATNNVISLDPGVRCFQTGYCPDTPHVVEISNDNSKLWKLLEKIDKFTSWKSKKIKNSRNYKRLTTKILFLHRQLKNMVSDMQWKACNFLVSNYGSVILPEFRTSEMLKKKKLARRTKRMMNTLSHFKFKQKLEFKCRENRTKLFIVDESYTSKTCGSCGKLNDNLKSSKDFNCKNCGISIDRDYNGARNILIKNS